MSKIPPDLKYEKSHEWVKIEDNLARVGISDFAQEELHEIVYIELPEVGNEVTKGEEFAVVESVKARSEIYAPVSGKIVSVNTSLIESDAPARPELVNEDPYGNGWLIEIEFKNPDELDDLLSAEEYRKIVEK